MIDCKLQSRGLIENITHERPKVPKSIEDKCNKFIKTWSEETFEQNKKVETNKSDKCKDDSIVLDLENSRLVHNKPEWQTKKDEYLYFVKENNKYVTSSEGTISDQENRKVTLSHVEINKNECNEKFEIGSSVTDSGSESDTPTFLEQKKTNEELIKQEQEDFNDKLISYVKYMITKENDLLGNKRHVVWIHLKWEREGLQWERFEGMQQELKYTVASVVNKDRKLLAAVHTYETIPYEYLYDNPTPSELKQVKIPGNKKKRGKKK